MHKRSSVWQSSGIEFKSVTKHAAQYVKDAQEHHSNRVDKLKFDLEKVHSPFFHMFFFNTQKDSGDLGPNGISDSA